MSIETISQPIPSAGARTRNASDGNISTAVGVGLVAGLVSLLMSLEGMVEVLVTRDFIRGIIQVGPLLVLITFFLAGQFAVNRSHVAARSVASIVVGAVAGLVDSMIVVLMVIALAGAPNLRDVFVNTSPALVTLLTFGQPLAMGVAVLLVLGAGLGALAGVLRFLPSYVTRGLISAAAWLFLLALLQELLRITGQSLTLNVNGQAVRPLGLFIGLFFSSNGFTLPGAAALFLIIFAGYFISATRGQQIRTGYRQLSGIQRRTVSGGVLILVSILLLLLPQILGLFFSEVLVNTGLYLLMGLGLNIVVGFAGLLDLGYVAFFAIGAYTMAALTSTEVVFHIQWSFWEALPLAVLAAVIAGVMLGIPVLRVRGDYLAIVTLGFGEIIRLLVASDLLKPWLGDGLGLHAIPKPVVGPVELSDSPRLYYLVLLGCLLVFFVARRLKNSRLGRAWVAIREDEDAAESMGIDLIRTKLLAFATGASFGGLAGAIFASKLQTIYPSSFQLLTSINVLALIIIGGMGSIPGVMIGALALVGLPELLREFSDFRLMLYGAVLVLMMLVRPEGLLPEARRREELEEFKEEEKDEDSVEVAEENRARNPT